MVTPLPLRAALGFLAGVISIMTFHQGLVGGLHALALPELLVKTVPYSMTPVPPFGVPAFISLSFWGGLYGSIFGLVAPKGALPYWLAGILTGTVASLVGIVLVATFKTTQLPTDWELPNLLQIALINDVWGLGLGLIFPVLLPQRDRLR